MYEAIVDGMFGPTPMPPERDWSKLKIVPGGIRFFVYQQDGSKRAMTIADTVGNRRLVEWIQIHDRYTTRPGTGDGDTTT